MKKVLSNEIIWKPFKRLGRGSFANVYQITLKLENNYKKPVAVKVIDETLINKNDLQNEILTLSLLSGLIDNMIGFEGVLTLNDKDNDDRPYATDLAKGTIHHCLVMELMDMTLDDLIFETTSRLSLSTVRGIAKQIAKGMAELHSFKVLHRDLKPANILLKKRNQIVMNILLRFQILD